MKVIKRIRYVIVRTKDETVFCGLVADIMNVEDEE